jgi:S1-C subfamily serine protease
MIIAAVVALVLAVALAAGAFAVGRATRSSALIQPIGGSTAGNAPATGNGNSNSATSAQVAAIAAKVNPFVVDVNTTLGYANGKAAGTGIVLTSDGLVLTNNHVVSGATSISVTDVGNGKTYTATVVGYDRSHDIAVLRLAGASGLATATLADSSTVNTGDSVVAVGNAGGTGGTPTAVGGTVSALNQSITAQDESSGSSEQLTGLIEVAADIEAGDSGGPLVNSSGQVIGIDTAAASSGGNQFQQQASTTGDGFAIPINTAITIAKQIEAGTASSTVHIGTTAFLGIEVSGQSSAGAAVVGTLSGSPAAAAGLGAGDVIQSLNGKTVDSATTLTTLLDGYHPGDKVKVGWVDASGQSHTSTITLTTGPVG